MLKRFLENRSGAYAMMTAVLSLPLLLGAGLAVDYAHLLKAHSELQELADGASLALAASKETDKKKLRQMADDHIQANAAPGMFKSLAIAKLDLSEKDRVAITLDGQISAFLMGLANQSTLDTSALAVAVRGMSGAVEVALVLDNTDSMNQDGKIGALKVAAANLADELFKEKKANVRLALVPYGEQVNVGVKHRKAAWLSVPGDYAKTTTTTQTSGGYFHQPMRDTGKCLEWTEAGSRQEERDGVWVTITWDRSCKTPERVANGEPVWVPETTQTSTSTTTYQWYGCVGSRVAAGSLVLKDGEPGLKYPGFVDTRQKCLTEILPLTAEKNEVKNAIAGMITSRPGYTPQTYIPAGLMWGVNVLSPEAPFTDGAAYDANNAKPRKVIVLMTDGLNTRRANLTGALNMDYLTGGALIGDYASADTAQRVQTNADTMALCNFAKAQKIEIFTVAFKVDDGPAKAMLQSCATDAEHYHDAGDSQALVTAFADIARSLVKVRLAE